MYIHKIHLYIQLYYSLFKKNCTNIIQVEKKSFLTEGLLARSINCIVQDHNSTVNLVIYIISEYKMMQTIDVNLHLLKIKIREFILSLIISVFSIFFCQFQNVHIRKNSINSQVIVKVNKISNVTSSLCGRRFHSEGSILIDKFRLSSTDKSSPSLMKPQTRKF